MDLRHHIINTGSTRVVIHADTCKDTQPVIDLDCTSPQSSKVGPHAHSDVTSLTISANASISVEVDEHSRFVPSNPMNRHHPYDRKAWVGNTTDG